MTRRATIINPVGIKNIESPSCFIDAWDLQDASDENKSWLLDKDKDEIDYTKFGNMRKIDF